VRVKQPDEALEVSFHRQLLHFSSFVNDLIVRYVALARLGSSLVAGVA
jgi:hypothetical protein